MIYNDDCFNVFNKLKDIDLVLVDLPYGQTHCYWDTCIDLKKMWIELKKICKKNCIYIFFTTTKFGVDIINSNPKWFRYDIVWEKSRKVGFLNANKQPLRKHEMIYVFKEKQGTYNPQKTKGKSIKYKDLKSKKSNGIYDFTLGEKRNFISNDRHPISIIKFNNPKKSLHRTQKPVDLCEWLISTYSNEDDTVLDFCMGSGTTSIACKNTNRKFIGIEKDKDIFEIAKKRIQT